MKGSQWTEPAVMPGSLTFWSCLSHHAQAGLSVHLPSTELSHARGSAIVIKASAQVG